MQPFRHTFVQQLGGNLQTIKGGPQPGLFLFALPIKRRKAPRFSHGDISRSLVPLYRNSETKLIGQLLLT